MPKEDWGFLNEKAFEAALQASVPERLPDKAAAVTPWKRAMGRVLAGTALTALGTNLWGLNYLLPGIGLVLMLLGFRLLWREAIEACRGAIQMVVSVQEFDQKGGFCRSSGSNPLCITEVGVKLTGEPAGWMIFHHFLWNTAPPFHGTAAIQLCRYTSRMSCGAPPERSPAGFCTIGAGRPSGRPTTLWRRIPPPTDIRASMDSGTFSGHFLCPLRRSTGGAMWSMPPMKFLTQNTEMCWIAGSITAIRTDFCNTRQNGTGENRMSNHGAFRTVWSDLRYGPEVTPPAIKKNDQRNDPPAKAGGSF